jgi:hypothetical protein
MNVSRRVSLSDSEIQELKAFTQLLKVLADGVVRPNNIKYFIRDVEEAERVSGRDLSKLKECCLPEGTIREAKDFKPYIDLVLKRISDITGLKPDPVFGDR